MRRREGAGGLNLSARSPHSVRTTRAVAGCFATTAVEKTSDASALRVAGGPIARLSPATRHGLRGDRTRKRDGQEPPVKPRERDIVMARGPFTTVRARDIGSDPSPHR